LTAEPRLGISPSAFLGVLLVGRFLTDGHLGSIFRRCSELRWARKEVLISTSTLLDICVGAMILENAGVKVVTYIKPIMMLVFFGFSNFGFHAIGSYSIAFANPAK